MTDLDERLRDAGTRWRAEQTTPDVDVGRAMRPAPRRGRAAVTVAIAAVAAVLLVALLAPGRARHPEVLVTPTTVAPPLDVIELNSAIAQPTTLAAYAGRIWVSGYSSPLGVSQPAHLQEIDASTGKVVGEVTLPDDSPSGIRIGAGGVWLFAQQREESTEVLKIDSGTLAIVKRIPSPATGQVAVTPGAVWATDGVGGVRRIDPATGRIVATIELPRAGIYPALGVTAGPSGVWVANGYDGSVQPIDAATNTAGPVIRVTPPLASMVEANGALWVMRSTGDQLVEIVGNKVARTIDLGERTSDIATDDRAIWLATQGAHVLRVDTNTGDLTRVALPPGTDSTVLAVDQTTGSVWVASMKPTPRLLLVPSP